MMHIKKIHPMLTNILTTGDRYEEDVRENGVIVASKGDLKLYQKVLAVGSMIRDIKVGDMIMFSPKNYATMKYDANSLKNDMDMNKVVRFNFPWVTIYDEEDKPQEYLLLTDRDIEFVFEGEEVNDSIIIPGKPTFMLN